MSDDNEHEITISPEGTPVTELAREKVMGAIAELLETIEMVSETALPLTE